NAVGVAFSPDGRHLVSGSRDGTLILWDTASGQEVRMLKGHSGRGEGLAFRPAGQQLASGGAGGIGKLWDTGPGRGWGHIRGPGGGSCVRSGATLVRWAESCSALTDGAWHRRVATRLRRSGTPTAAKRRSHSRTQAMSTVWLSVQTVRSW